MCQALMEPMKDEIEEREEIAAREAEKDTRSGDIKNLMSSLGYTAEQAMDVLKIPQDQRYIYVTHL